MNIRLSGHPGSGKATFARVVSAGLGLEYHYVRSIIQQMAADCNMPIEEFYSLIAADPETEKKIDTYQELLMIENDNLLVQGRMAPFLKSGFPTVDVLLMVDEEEGARRQLKRPENQHRTLEEVLSRSRKRLGEERKRYFELYEVEDHLDPNYFDIVIDTSGMSPEEVVSAFNEILDDIDIDKIIRDKKAN